MTTGVKVHPKRAVECPKCGVDVGKECVTPKGHSYPQSHKARLPDDGDRLPIKPHRMIECPECGAEVGRVCLYPSGHRYEDSHLSRRIVTQDDQNKE